MKGIVQVNREMDKVKTDCQKGDDLESILLLLWEEQSDTFLFSIFTGCQIVDLNEIKKKNSGIIVSNTVLGFIYF